VPEPVVAEAVPSRTPLAEIDPFARPTVVPFMPYPVPVVRPNRRETGTDGLMGRLPFDLPPDPVIRRANRFTTDDDRRWWAVWDTTPPWVRRVGVLSNSRTDMNRR
jgi:hypothetical protein